MSNDPTNPDKRRRPPRARPVTGNTAPPEPPDVEVDEEPDEEPDPDSLRGRFRDPGVRNYLFAGLAALAMVFVILFGEGADIGGLVLVALGVAGLVLRWTAAPPLFLILLTYLLIFPFGVPDVDFLYPDRFRIESNRFWVGDLFLAFSVVTYLACTYRMLGLTLQAIPHDVRFPKKSDKPTRRPAELIVPGEIARLLYVTAGVVLVGQLVWLFMTALEIDIGAFVPLKVATPRRPGRDMHPTAMRMILLAGLLFFGTMLARLVFGYWRLRLMTAAEGAMVLQDAGWDETHRERVRLEKWRAWAKARAAEEAKKTEKLESGGER